MISKIDEVKIQGYGAPLTRNGNFIAENMIVSCYAIIRNHELADFVMWPLKTFSFL